MKRIVFTIILTFVLSAISLAQHVASDSVRLTSIGSPWWLVIDAPGLEVKSVGTKADGAYFLLYPTKDELNVSLWIEPAAKCKTSVECRDFVLSSGNPRWGAYEKLNKASFGKFDYFEFHRPTVQERPVQMQDMYAQHVNAGYWLDVHISKALYKPEDKVLFEKLLNSMRFVAKETKSSVPQEVAGIVASGRVGQLSGISRNAVKVIVI